jgi:ferritin-like metal-binding protein YciE
VPDLQAKDLKLIQYLNEAYAKETQLETALQAHIAMTTRDAYRKRLQQHLKETKAHSRDVKRRIKQLGGTAQEVDVPGPDVVTEGITSALDLARKGIAAMQGPVHTLRGTGEQEKLLKNAKTEFQDEAEEIATYISIEELANAVGDKETAQLARRIRREEERMRDFLGRLIPQLTKAVAQEEIPAAERRTSRRRSSSRRSSSSSSSSGGSSSRSSSRSGSSSRKSSSSSSRKTTSGKTTSRSKGGRSTARSGGAKSSSSRSGGSSSRSSSARKSTARSGGSSSRSSSARKSTSRSGGGSRSSGGRKKS